MSVPAVPDDFTADDWARALDGRPDLLARLHAGDVEVLSEILELHPDVTVRSLRERA